MGACPKGTESPKRTSGVLWLFMESSGSSVCFKDTKSLLPVSFSFQVLKNTSHSSMAFDPVVGVGLADNYTVSQRSQARCPGTCVFTDPLSQEELSTPQQVLSR